MDWLDFVVIGAAALALVTGIYEFSTKKCITKSVNKIYTKDSVKKYIPYEATAYIIAAFGLVGVAIGDLPEIAEGNWVSGGFAAIIAALFLVIYATRRVLKNK